MIKITNLNKYYNKNKSNQIHVINNSSIEFPKTGLVSIHGESGCGKTTLLNVIGGLDDFYSGTIVIDEVEIKKYNSRKIDRIRNEKIGYIFQNYLLLQQRTVYENLKIVLDMYDISDEDINKRIDYVLKAVGMLKYKKKNISELSGGQQQRISIARALIKSPALILADEPTGNLDEKNTIEIMNILKKISKTTLVILVSHEQSIVNSYSDFIIEVKDGTVISQKDVINADKYRYSDDQNIYLKEYECKTVNDEFVNIEYYTNEKQKINLKIIYENGKVYISSQDNAILIDESSEVKIIDDFKKEIDTEELSEESDYELEKLKYVQNPSLSFKDIVKLANENLKKLKSRTLTLSISLFIISILVLLSVHSLIISSKVDYQTLTYTHSDIYNLTFEKADVNTTYYDQKDGFKIFYKEFMKDNPNIKIVVDDRATMKYTVNSFEQVKNNSFKIDGFSLLTTEQLPTDNKLLYGRLPENSKEIIIEKWVLEKAINSSTLGNFITVKSFVNETVKIGSVNFDFKVVGIADNNEHAIYVNKWHMFDIMETWFHINKMSIGSIEELGKYVDVSNFHLQGKECLLNNVKNYSVYNNSIVINNDLQNSYYVVDKVNFGGAPFDIVVNESQYNELLGLILDRNWEKMSLLCNNEERKQVDNYIESVSEKYKNGTYKSSSGKDIKILILSNSDYDDLINPYIENAKKVVKSRILITVFIVFISIFIVLFSMKSYAMKNIYDIGVYRAIGIKKTSVVLIYAFENLIISLKTTLIGGVLCYIITNIIGSIPVVEANVAISIELFIISILSLIFINIIVGVMPIITYLSLIPSKILTKYDG